MSLQVVAAPPEGCEFMCKMLGLQATPHFRAIQAQKPTGEVVGMVGFDRWTDNCAEMHIWLSNPSALRALLWEAFDYLFVQCGKDVALGVVAGLNARALRMDQHIGFVELARIRDGKAKGEDLVILELRKENCRWLKKPEKRAA